MRRAEVEQLRQESETFDFNKRKAHQWSRLQLCLGWTALGIFVTVAILCSAVIILHQYFLPDTGKWALGVLGGDLLALAGTVVRMVFGGSQSQVLQPVTRASEPTNLHPRQ